MRLEAPHAVDRLGLVLEQRLEQRRDVRRVVLQVGVHDRGVGPRASARRGAHGRALAAVPVVADEPRTASGHARSSSSRVPSVEPSSTTITSTRRRESASSIWSIARSTVAQLVVDGHQDRTGRASRPAAAWATRLRPDGRPQAAARRAARPKQRLVGRERARGTIARPRLLDDPPAGHAEQVERVELDQLEARAARRARAAARGCSGGSARRPRSSEPKSRGWAGTSTTSRPPGEARGHRRHRPRGRPRCARARSGRRRGRTRRARREGGRLGERLARDAHARVGAEPPLELERAGGLGLDQQQLAPPRRRAAGR